ncbi:sensor histidine kinase [Chitinophaga rhizosphaerae]|uniref:sensor histidine kinase n=1 Tax=Chitinophaga rhizosphaerae TaxID=1864947 RepID=UPI000F805E0A|nr:histidine kinase [Chitinophaga rhizosphaerae]
MKTKKRHENVLAGMRGLELWLLAGWFAWIAAVYTLGAAGGGWAEYGMIYGLVAICQLPVWLYVALRGRWAESTALWRRISAWGLVFVVWLWLNVLGMESLRLPDIPGGCFATAAMGTMVIEVAVLLQACLRKSGGVSGWWRRISLERAVLFTIVLIALTLAAMAVSSMDDPRYNEEGFLLIGFEFSLPALFRHWWSFWSFALQFCVMYACGYLFFYINSRVLVARVLKRYGILLYAGGVLATAALLYPVIAQLLLWLPVNRLLGGVFPSNPFVLENAFAAIMIMLISLPLVVAIQWGRQNSQIAALEKEKAQAELDLLKQQLNPHFFFNTLNNLYALSLTQSDRTPESILQLSELMRYVIYRGKEEAVEVEEEVRYLENYIALAEIRLKRRADIRFERDIRVQGKQISPLLLAVLVENAFKHGVEPAAEAAHLHISLYCDEAQLRFRCENSFVSVPEGPPGIGLANLRRRLGLLYPGHHSIETGAKNHTFIAELIIDFS